MRRTSSCRRSKYPPTLRPVFACPRPIRRKSPRAASPYRAARIWPSKAGRTDVSNCMSARASTGSPSRNSRTGRADPFRRRVCVTCRRCFVRKVRMTAKQSRYRGIPHRIPRYYRFSPFPLTKGMSYRPVFVARFLPFQNSGRAISSALIPEITGRLTGPLAVRGRRRTCRVSTRRSP